MMKNIIHEHGGLYGRITGQLQVFPFTLYFCEEYFRSRHIRLTCVQIAQRPLM